MKQDKTLLKIVQKIQRNELIRYASNLGLELDETWNISKLRKAYTEFILSDPKKLLLMLPKADLDIIRKNHGDGSPDSRKKHDSFLYF